MSVSVNLYEIQFEYIFHKPPYLDFRKRLCPSSILVHVFEFSFESALKQMLPNKWPSLIRYPHEVSFSEHCTSIKNFS